MPKLMLCAATTKTDSADSFNDCKIAIEKHFGSFRFDEVNKKWIFRVDGKRHNMPMHQARHYAGLCNRVISAHRGVACDPVQIIK